MRGLEGREDQPWRSGRDNCRCQVRWGTATHARYCCGRRRKASGPNARKGKYLRTWKSKPEQRGCKGDSTLGRATCMRTLPFLLSRRSAPGPPALQTRAAETPERAAAGWRTPGKACPVGHRACAAGTAGRGPHCVYELLRVLGSPQS